MADGEQEGLRSATILSRPHCWHRAGPAASTQQHGSARRLRGQSSPMSPGDKPGKALPRTVESQAIAGASPAACNFLMEVEVVARVKDKADLVISCKSAQTRQSEDDPSIAQHQQPQGGLRWGLWAGPASGRRNGHLWGISSMLAASLSCLIRFQVAPWSLSHQRADDLGGPRLHAQRILMGHWAPRRVHPSAPPSFAGSS